MKDKMRKEGFISLTNVEKVKDLLEEKKESLNRLLNYFLGF